MQGLPFASDVRHLTSALWHIGYTKTG